MHLFLTGEIQVGKSTLIRQAVRQLGVTPGGFVTGFCSRERSLPDRSLYLNPAWTEPAYDPAHTVVRFRSGERPSPDPAAFNRLGCRFIEESRGWANLMIMDECGQLEQEADAFRQCVLDSLNGSVPVIGVLKRVRCEWLDAIARHPAVTLIEVTVHNRDGLLPQVTERLARAVNPS
ncbi:MAG: nucleoside-triphosphatase [Paenibacillaceae bacterium]|jgi:nucleoside-triphosphatase|nr:nucleoside-triphosphatase [Paenibacillaceae bacterium]